MADQERMEREDSISSQDPHNKKVKKAKNRRPASMFALARRRRRDAAATEGCDTRGADKEGGCSGMNDGAWTVVYEDIRRTYADGHRHGV